jgi:cytochrome c oxidase subunit 2
MKSAIKSRRLALLAPLLGLASCSYPQSMLNPHGKAANHLATLIWIEVILFCAIAFGMWVLLSWAVARKRGTLQEHAPYNMGGGQSWVWVGGFAFPFVVLSTVFGLSLSWLNDFPVDAQMKSVAPDISVIGHQWWWELRYVDGPVNQHFITANEIHIPVGRPINIELETRDVIHSFWVPPLHGKVDLIPGQPNFIRIEADKPGIYSGQCAEYCGMQHAHMRLIVVAQTPEEYKAWCENELKPADEPTNADAMHGRDVFMNGPCILCHAVRGTLALGRVAPDLTHIGSRRYIAANTYPNNTANLEAWVTHAQSLKRGAEMPNLTAFNGTDLRALVDYLQQLK